MLEANCSFNLILATSLPQRISPQLNLSLVCRTILDAAPPPAGASVRDFGDQGEAKRVRVSSATRPEDIERHERQLSLLISVILVVMMGAWCC
jgi:hypothetical protein